MEAKVPMREDGAEVVGGIYGTAVRASSRVGVVRRMGADGGEQGGGAVEVVPIPRRSTRLPLLGCQLCPTKLRDAHQLELHFLAHFRGSGRKSRR